jgi:hypothetical protein
MQNPHEISTSEIPTTSFDRSAAVQDCPVLPLTLSFIGFDTPAKIVWEEAKRSHENFNYAGIVTKMVATDFANLFHGPIPIFF